MAFSFKGSHRQILPLINRKFQGRGLPADSAGPYIDIRGPSKSKKTGVGNDGCASC